jgi:hypothetical protein
MLTECLFRYGQMTRSDIGGHVGGIGYRRVSQLRRAFREAAESDPHAQDLFVPAQRLSQKISDLTPGL